MESYGDVVTAIDGLDLTAIKYKLMVEKEWSVAKLESVELLYKRFLTLVALYPSHTIVPNGDIDEFWHAHILDTRKYASDMERCLGYFLHHFPYFGLRGDDDHAEIAKAFEKTSRLYIQEFGRGEPSFSSSHDQQVGVVCGGGGGGGGGGKCRTGRNHFEDVDFSEAYDVAAKTEMAA